MTATFETLKETLTCPPVVAFPDLNSSFIVETIASNAAFGAFQAQKKVFGKIHQVQYANRTMNSAERNYFACDVEALAVIFALRKCRVYLLSTEPLKLITDHQPIH